METLYVICLISGMLFIGFGISTANGSDKDSKGELVLSILTAICAMVFISALFIALILNYFTGK
ncbi:MULTISPECIES: hypothetical protein [unclassified Chryseobacterium]|uniref:hypothetical protein n=1 Tax=unclassified Chryseobacterium TaxID=2593645 RepID=UPI00285323EA|nr:hypothetical protein [Chryseobacterium sp. CFS7]MDR4892254.1 hypothetical protein [Chryseobacterium sp. CFS7]